ncbi:DUF4249 domain-containing protein [Psychroflexus salinarum]|uniref:DUF4249 domain-containing protein n=1 Tax=Psychroflexus salinarum TaxID=546024 RepID=A0ABW3GP49_9FLAO
MKLKSKYILLFLFTAIVAVSCVEEIPLETEGFESAIVIEGTVTNEVKQHQIKLSETYAIATTGPNPLSGADVRVVGNSQHVFEETEPGIYISRDSFAAESGVDYQLRISVNGQDYESESMQLPMTSSIGELEANRITLQGEDGVAITLNNQNISGIGNYYRYEYIETFKFTSNMFKTNDIIIEDGIAKLVPKLKEEYTCYQTNQSQDLILANTNSLIEDSVNNLLINFVDSDEPKISNRYSLLVKQYVISREAYTYFEILEKLSNSDNLFSQIQPGFFAGNISNISNQEEKIIGFFDISSVSTKRIYFNYEDFYDPQNIRPKFVPNSACEVTFPEIGLLIQQIANNAIRWYETPLPLPLNQQQPVLVVPRRCVDCTVFGSNEKPEFWEE